MTLKPRSRNFTRRWLLTVANCSISSCWVHLRPNTSISSSTISYLTEPHLGFCCKTLTMPIKGKPLTTSLFHPLISRSMNTSNGKENYGKMTKIGIVNTSFATRWIPFCSPIWMKRLSAATPSKGSWKWMQRPSRDFARKTMWVWAATSLQHMLFWCRVTRAMSKCCFPPFGMVVATTI